MAALVRCHKCKKIVSVKNTALCCACDNRYELSCDGYPEATYKLKDAESKKKWRCSACVRSKKYSNVGDGGPSAMTLRKKTLSKIPSPADLQQRTKKVQQQPRTRNSTLTDSHILTDCETSDESYTTPNKTSVSMDGTVTDFISISDMKETITQLSNKLQTTENDLASISLQNRELHLLIDKLNIEITTLKSLCYSSSLYEGPDTNKNIKNHALLPQNICSTPPSPSSAKISVNTTDDDIIRTLNLQITSLQQQLKVAEEEIVALTKRVSLIMQHNYTLPTCDSSSSIQLENLEQPNYVHSKFEDTTQQEHNIQICKMEKKRILIFGAQQCVGLASALWQSRFKTQYETYEVIGETNPNALSTQVVKNCLSAKLRQHDVLVVCIGENDRNINGVVSQLKTLLNRFKDNLIFVLGVNNSYYYNVNKLNNYLENVCKQYRTCTFIRKTSKALVISECINYYLDCNYYNEKFLCPTQIRKLIAHNSSKSNNCTIRKNEPKKGTIPFYFNNNLKKNIDNTSQSLIPKLSIEQPVKGTIPYYFQKLNKTGTFFRASQHTPTKQ